MYRQSAAGIEPSKREDHEMEGYIMAALECGLIEKEVLQAFINNIHERVFGQTIKERREERKSRGHFLGQPDSNYENYEAPTWVRKGIKVSIN